MHKPPRHPSNRPFLTAPRPEFYHPAKGIDAALHGLDRAIRRGEGIGLVIGGPGTGKSLLLSKVAESVRDDFDVALLSGARICTRRALWQSILAEIGESYRGIDEGELCIAVVERIRGLAATGAGLVILVDEAHTLPSRLVDELRLLMNVPTPLPAVHIVLAGNLELEEMLASPKLESLTQRIAVRSYLEPLDHAETLAYLRTQARSANLDWDAIFEPGCDDAVFTATDGVPRLINQICDHALLIASATGRQRATPNDVAAAWREIQRLPPPTPVGLAAAVCCDDYDAGQGEGMGEGMGVIEFGSLDGETFGRFPAGGAVDVPSVDDTVLDMSLAEGDAVGIGSGGDDASEGSASFLRSMGGAAAGGVGDPWHGPEVELVFDPSADPFEEYFEQEERVIERYVMRGPDDFSDRRHVASRDGSSMSRRLDDYERAQAPAVVSRVGNSEPEKAAAVEDSQIVDDSDMVVIEEDLFEHPSAVRRSIFPVRPGDYRHLFARLRRGDGVN